MAYAFNVNRVTISGDCFAGAEVWSTGFWMGSTTADAADPAGMAINIAEHWNTFFTTASTSISSAYRTLQVKVAQHKSSDMKVDLTKVDFYDLSPVITGAGASTAMPAQTALVGTLTSEIQRGTASKGRMYLPGVNGTVQSTGKILSSLPGFISTNLKTMFDGINGDIDIPGSVILVSKGNKLTLEPGGDVTYINPLNATVTGLRVGDVYDTQRRRRNGLTEVYSTKVLA